VIIKSRKFFRLSLAAILILSLIFSLLLIRSKTSGAPDFPVTPISQSSKEVEIDISEGETGSQIAASLFAAGVVKSVEAFFRVAVSDKRSTRIAPGRHRISLKISARQALDQLLDTGRISNLIKVSEGARKSEIASLLIARGFTKSEVNSAMGKLLLPSGFKDPEGLLFPAQYSLIIGASVLEILQSMIARFISDPEVKKLLMGDTQFNALKLLTMASIIQAEGDSEDFSKISRVIRNRLKIGMPLQVDSTIHYARKTRGQLFLSTKSTLINSPYNTYQRYGLPPTPIGNPGAAAISAALNPASGDWLYFITVAPADTRFTESHGEFLAWKALYQKNRKAGAFEVKK